MLRLLTPGRHLPLLLALVALFTIYPLMVAVDRLAFFRFVFVGVLALAAYSVGGGRKQLWTALLLGVPAALSQLVAYARPAGVAPLSTALLSLLFLAYVTLVVFRSVVRAGRVTTDKIAGAIAVYLLLGLMWALLYGTAEMLDPTAFRAPAEIDLRPDVGGAEYSFIYYSFVTLTTLGYGEISPATPWSQALAWMEAVTGQLFLVILIARLVSLQILHGDADADGGREATEGREPETIGR